MLTGMDNQPQQPASPQSQAVPPSAVGGSKVIQPTEAILQHVQSQTPITPPQVITPQVDAQQVQQNVYNPPNPVSSPTEYGHNSYTTSGQGMFSRRIGRLGFLLGFVYWILLSLVMLAIVFMDSRISVAGVRGVANLISGLLLILIGIYSLPLFISLYVRRLHDLNKSGLLSLLVLVPLVNLLLLLYLYFAPGTDENNMHGDSVDSLNMWVILGFKKP